MSTQHQALKKIDELDKMEDYMYATRSLDADNPNVAYWADYFQNLNNVRRALYEAILKVDGKYEKTVFGTNVKTLLKLLNALPIEIYGGVAKLLDRIHGSSNDTVVAESFVNYRVTLYKVGQNVTMKVQNLAFPL